MAAQPITEIDKQTRCLDAFCWQRDTCERFVHAGHAADGVQVAGSLRARWQAENSVCLHYIEEGAVS